MLRTDVHSHLMPGVDDGSRSPVETVAMARGLVELGVERLYLTPHQFKLENRFDAEELVRRTEDVARLLAGAGIALEVRPGAEHFYGEALLDAISGGPGLVTFEWEKDPCLLVELPMHQPSVGVRRVGEAILRRGIRPVLAHPERTAGISRDLDRARGWHEAGWSFQLNLLSLVGRHGAEAEEVARELLAAGLYEFVGSDLHRPAELPYLRDAHAAFRTLAAGHGVAS
jgi:tyrosine-protein phosphatase YwqE